MPSAGVPTEAAAALVTAMVFTVATAVGAAGRPLVLARDGPREPLGAVVGASGPGAPSEGSGDTFSGSGVSDPSTLFSSFALVFAIASVTSCYLRL